jgi:seryl-tRNA synthetase
MKANIKRKKVVTALDYVGLNYLSNLVQRKEIQCFDDTFFEVLVKEINRIRSVQKSIQNTDEALKLKSQIDKLQKSNNELQQELHICQNIRRANQDLKLENELLIEELEQLKNTRSLSPQAQAQLQQQLYLAQQIEDLFNVPKE